jgi:hypothetical protein
MRTDFANAEPSHTDWVLWRDAQEIIRRTKTLESAGIYSNAISNLAGDGPVPPEALYGLRISASLFPTLGVTPMLGRNILPDEDQPAHANEMILSYGLWVRRFNKDRNVIGRNVQIDGHDCLVIGVMPQEFNFPMRRSAAHTPSPYVEFWSPMRADPATATGDPAAIGMVGRVRGGVSLAKAQQDLTFISNALSSEYPAVNRDHQRWSRGKGGFCVVRSLPAIASRTAPEGGAGYLLSLATRVNAIACLGERRKKVARLQPCSSQA